MAGNGALFLAVRQLSIHFRVRSGGADILESWTLVIRQPRFVLILAFWCNPQGYLVAAGLTVIGDGIPGDSLIRVQFRP